MLVRQQSLFHLFYSSPSFISHVFCCKAHIIIIIIIILEGFCTAVRLVWGSPTCTSLYVRKRRLYMTYGWHVMGVGSKIQVRGPFKQDAPPTPAGFCAYLVWRMTRTCTRETRPKSGGPWLPLPPPPPIPTPMHVYIGRINT